MYLCPLCQSPLIQEAQQYRCAQRHSFDLAREGYVNLLPVQQKKSKDPGDNQLMMQARRQFLQAGWYQPVVHSLIGQLQKLQLNTLLDLGCGEGYYSGQLQQAMPELALDGVDISKAAIKAAAKQYPGIRFVVASSYQLPFAAGSFDAILRIYAPSLDSELCRVLSAGGYLLSVSPAPEHLHQIKAAIYPQVRLHSNEIIEITGMQHQQRQRLSFQLQLPADDLRALVTMVPLGWKFNPESLAAFIASKPIMQCDFYLDLYQKL
jgi:23S rRNA (guanine745-N1)-methyltransferase